MMMGKRLILEQGRLQLSVISQMGTAGCLTDSDSKK
jgi:hypothetical protein